MSQRAQNSGIYGSMAGFGAAGEKGSLGLEFECFLSLTSRARREQCPRLMVRKMRIGIATPKRGFAGGLERYSWMVGRGLRERGHFVRHLFSSDEGRDVEAFAGGFSEPSTELSSSNVESLDVVFAQRIDHPDELEPFGNKPLLIASHDHAHTCIRTYRYVPLGSTPCHRAPGVACVLARRLGEVGAAKSLFVEEATKILGGSRAVRSL